MHQIHQQRLGDSPITETNRLQLPISPSTSYLSMKVKVPFRYSNLAYGLSLCMLAHVCLLPTAFAAELGAANQPESSGTNDDSQTLNQIKQSVTNGQSSNDKTVEEALIALRLKQAVEKGHIDPSVLEDYQRETLNTPVGNNSDSDNSRLSNNKTNNSDTGRKNGSQNSNNLSSDNGLMNDAEKDAASSLDQSLQDPSLQNNSTNSDTRSGKSNQQDSQASHANQDSDAIFNRIFADDALDKDLSSELNSQNGLTDNSVTQSPQQLDVLLSDIGTEVSSDFDAPVARLDAVTPPIGFDSELDKRTQINPNNRKTLGWMDEPAADPEVSGQGANMATDSGTTPVFKARDVDVSPEDKASPESQNDKDVSPSQSISTPVGQVASEIKQAGEITDDVVAEAQEKGTLEPGINPEDYLPDYQGDANQNDLGNVVTDAADDDSRDSANKQGFFKGLYNRLFNGGVASLPRIEADVFIDQNQDQSGIAQPKLVKVDNKDQPFANIKAAMENITVESISDFTAVTPKLYEEAINAAQAVGYYDVDLRFQKVADDKIAVIIESLGEPVKVNSRIIDIRGEGQELKEFKEIVESAPPTVDSTFNHGVYKQTKRNIETTKEQFGFFDGQWLNSSVDVILPDNTADVDLIYDTGERYRFDNVVFFTIDPDTGQLTTDPDKLPVKSELLHQLHEFKAGDKFYAPSVTKFTNDLSATRYFNVVNVETVRPGSSAGRLEFEGGGSQDNPDNDDSRTEDTFIPDGLNLNAKSSGDTTTDSRNLNPNQAEDQAKAELNGGENYDYETDLRPIEYSIDQETSDKLAEITAKAERLSRLPDDRVLDETEQEAKTLLGKISNAVSKAVEKIIPDDDDPFARTDSLPQDLSNTILANRKTPEQVAETKSVPLYVFVTADKPKDVDLGIGYGTDTGVRAVARLEHNLINRDGYQAGISVGASGINQSIDVHASRPWKHPLDDTLSANVSYEQETINQGKGNLDLDTRTIKAGVARNIRNETGWNRTYSLKYRVDELESGVKGTDRENLPVPFNREGAKFNQEALLLGYQMDKTTADNAMNPTKGFHQYYSIEAGSDSALTDTNMAIARAGVTGVYSFGEMNKHQVLASLDGGYIWADDFENVPYKLRFFAGGDRSIRGYDYNSLSALEKGYLVGGQVLAVGSAEYNYEFKPGLRGAVFADAGNAYDKNFEADTKLGVGFGIRWASPVGMVRLDLAAGVLEESIPIRLHFFIGSPLQ